jgi:hypothetical protein
MSRCSQGSRGRRRALSVLSVSGSLVIFRRTSFIMEITWVKISGINPPLVLEVLTENRPNRDGCIQLLAESRSGSFFPHRSRTIVPILSKCDIANIGRTLRPLFPTSGVNNVSQVTPLEDYSGEGSPRSTKRVGSCGDGVVNSSNVRATDNVP